MQNRTFCVSRIGYLTLPEEAPSRRSVSPERYDHRYDLLSSLGAADARTRRSALAAACEKRSRVPRRTGARLCAARAATGRPRRGLRSCGLQCRAPLPCGHQASGHSASWLSLAGDRKRPQDLG